MNMFWLETLTKKMEFLFIYIFFYKIKESEFIGAP